MRCLIAGALVLAATTAYSLELTEEQIEVLTRDLADPLSAQFRNVRQSESSETTICGEMNAKNRYGGYAGFTKFWFAPEFGEYAFEPDLAYELHTSMLGCD